MCCLVASFAEGVYKNSVEASVLLSRAVISSGVMFRDS